MSKWVDRIVGHPVWQQLKTTAHSATCYKVDDDEAGAAEVREDLDRFVQVLTFIHRRLESSDPALLTPSQLGAINDRLATANNHLTTFHTSRQVGELSNAHSYLDGILDTFAVSTSVSIGDVEGIGDAVTSLRRSLGQHARHHEDQAGRVESALSAAQARAKEVAEDINGQKSRLDQAIAQFQQASAQVETARQEAARTAEAARDQEFKANEAERLRIAKESEAERAEKAAAGEAARDTAATESEATRKQGYDEQVASYANRFSGQLAELEAATHQSSQAATTAEEARDERFTKFDKETRKRVKDLTTQANADAATTLASLKDQLVQAGEIVGIIANTAMAGGYKKVANEEGTSFRVWQAVTVGSLVGLVGFAIYTALLTSPAADFHWGAFAARVLVVTAFGLLAAYAGRQAHEHLQRERRARTTELVLASIDAYLRPLDEPSRNELRRMLAERLFAIDGPLPPPPVVTLPVAEAAKAAVTAMNGGATKAS